MNVNKHLRSIISNAWEAHAKKGFWKKAKFSESREAVMKVKSFSLLERVEFEKRYFIAVHEYIKMKYDQSGLYTRKRGEAMLSDVRNFIEKDPEQTLSVGQRVRMRCIPDISKKQREGEIGSLDMIDDGIVDLVNCLEENGYQDTYGSCYLSEIELVLVDGHWRVFEEKAAE